MPSAKYRVLVVDDEVGILRILCRELLAQGFECDTAVDGDEALQLASSSRYDAVVTDLKMPNMHGHALAHQILHWEERPIIVVHTGVIEPRLAKDLLRLGVDDIVFKPTDFAFLAAKVAALLERRHAPENSLEPSARSVPDNGSEAALAEDSPSAPINLSRLNRKLGEMLQLLPISPTSLDVYEMTRSDKWHLSQIAATIQRDASLAAEVLRLANSSRFNPSTRRTVHLEEAVLRIGQNRIGELALCASALSAFTPGMLPWINLELAWKRSMASGIAIESLVERGGHQKIEEALLLSAIMQPLGRMVLGMLFPKHYDAMVSHCARTGETLRQQERHLFPTSHTEVMSHLLATWRIPPDLFLPLKFSSEDFYATASISEPMRTKTELVKTAVLIGRLAVGPWESWDLVQFPPPSVLKRLNIQGAGDIIRQVRGDVSKLADFHPAGGHSEQHDAPSESMRTVAYCNVSGESEDLLAELLPAMGLQTREYTVDDLRDLDEPWIANCIRTAPAALPANRRGMNTIVVTDQEHYDGFARYGRTVALPNSYRNLRDALLNDLESQEIQQPPELVPSLA